MESGRNSWLTGASAAFIGAFIASRLPARLLTIVFGCVVMVMAVRMLTARQPSVTGRRAYNYVQVVLWGPCLVSFPIIGVGGGGLMVPVMTNFLGFSVHEAVGTAAALMIFTALGGSLSYLINGLGVQGLPAYSTGISTGSSSRCWPAPAFPWPLSALKPLTCCLPTGSK